MTNENTETGAPARPRVRILVEVECDRELVPGFGYDPEDWTTAASQRVAAMLACYNPVVITTGVEYV